MSKRFPHFTRSLDCDSSRGSIALVAMLAGAAPALTFGRGPVVIVETHEPTLAAEMVRSIKGQCYGLPVEVDFHEAAPRLSVVVRVGSNTHTFGAGEEFVRLISPKVQFEEMWLYCENDPDKQILLAVMGVPIVEGLPKGAPWRARIAFDREATMTSFSGLKPTDDPAVITPSIR